jgi:hypothetical protein
MKDLRKARQECKKFIALMEHNRPNCDDAGVARRILEELKQYGDIKPTTRYRLSTWCDTTGAPYQRGVPIAQEISRALFGRVLRRDLPPPLPTAQGRG